MPAARNRLAGPNATALDGPSKLERDAFLSGTEGKMYLAICQELVLNERTVGP